MFRLQAPPWSLFKVLPSYHGIRRLQHACSKCIVGTVRHSHSTTVVRCLKSFLFVYKHASLATSCNISNKVLYLGTCLATLPALQLLFSCRVLARGAGCIWLLLLGGCCLLLCWSLLFWLGARHGEGMTFRGSRRSFAGKDSAQICNVGRAQSSELPSISWYLLVCWILLHLGALVCLSSVV